VADKQVIRQLRQAVELLPVWRTTTHKLMNWAIGYALGNFREQPKFSAISRAGEIRDRSIA
jgi:hypothetical protein